MHLNQFLNHINEIGIESFSLSLNSEKLDASMINAYNTIKRMYPVYKDSTVSAMCGLSKDGHI